MACSVVESVFAVGVSHLQQGTTPAIQQLLPYFTSKLIDETITSYVVLSEVGPSVNVECRNVLAVHDPWFGEGSPLGNLTSKQRGMSISAPIIGDATIVGHSVSFNNAWILSQCNTYSLPSVAYIGPTFL